MCTTSWNNELELTLIECYQAEPILWQSKHKDHKNKNKVHDAWTRISEILNIPVVELKKKKDSLMSSYRTYRKKVKDSTHSGAGSGEIYKPIWFAYTAMDSFLGEGVQCKETTNTEESPSVNVDEEEESSGVNVDSQPTRLQTIRRRKNPTELLDAGETVKDALCTLKETMNSRRIQEDDECDLHGKVIAKKLRKLPEHERMQFVCEIYNMFMRHEQRTPALFSPSVASPPPSLSPTCSYHKPGSKTRTYSEPSPLYQRAHSSHSNYSEPPIYYSPYPEVQIYEETPSPAASKVIITSNKVIHPATEDSTQYVEENAIDKAFNNA